jgi:hypothetical protein
MSVTTSSFGGPLTYDEALAKQIGQLGWGQWRTLLWASLPQISAAAAFFLWVFVTVDPVANHFWKCADTADAACAAVWQQEIPSSQSFCSLSREQWQWTNEGVCAVGTQFFSQLHLLVLSVRTAAVCYSKSGAMR